MIEPIDESVLRKRVEKYFEERKGLLIHGLAFLASNIGVWAFWLLVGPGSWPWPLIITLGWGAGILAHLIETEGKSPRRLSNIDRQVFDQMADQYGPDWREVADQSDYRRVQQAAHKRFNQMKELMIHGSIYALVNLAVWFVWGMVMRGAGLPYPLLMSVAWGLGLGIHALVVYQESGWSAASRERSIAETVERERQRLYGDAPLKEKRKHDRLILAEDGELLEIIEEDVPPSRQSQSQ